MAYFPFFIDIDNQKCLIVGGGTVAYRKVLVLKDYGPRIHVVAAEISGKIRDLRREKTAGSSWSRESLRTGIWRMWTLWWRPRRTGR